MANSFSYQCRYSISNTQSHYEWFPSVCTNVLPQQNHMQPIEASTPRHTNTQSHTKFAKNHFLKLIYSKSELTFYVTGIFNSHFYSTANMHLTICHVCNAKIFSLSSTHTQARRINSININGIVYMNLVSTKRGREQLENISKAYLKSSRLKATMLRCDYLILSFSIALSAW